MMRPLFALLGLLLLTGAAPVSRDWVSVVTLAPNGAYVIGNPAARVKLVEYASYTCPHCGAFAAESAPVLKARMVRSGSTSLEVRHYVRDALDLAAVVVARCGGPRRFAERHEAIFAGQSSWLQRGSDFQDANGERLKLEPELARLRAYADGSGLSAIGTAHGLTPAAISSCFATRAIVDKAIALTDSAPADLAGTPSFFVNGKLVPGVFGWNGLESVLRAAGAK